jgi:predicted amidohydrolase
MKFKVAIAQVNPRLGDLEFNLHLYEQEVQRSSELKTDLLVFPELSLTGYYLRDMVSSAALRLDAPETKRLVRLSKTVSFVAGLIEETPDYKFYNSAVYFEDGKIRHVHRKAYLPTYGMFDEQRYFARGNEIRAFDSKFGRMALLVCEDMWHPSAVYLAALDGALFILCLSSSPIRGISEGEVPENARYWELMNRGYAQTYSVYIVFANRVGFEDGIGFWGGSEVVDPSGTTSGKAKYYEVDRIQAEISLGAVRRRRIASPLLRDEDLDLTINELLRIRGRQAETDEKHASPRRKKPA